MSGGYTAVQTSDRETLISSSGGAGATGGDEMDDLNEQPSKPRGTPAGRTGGSSRRSAGGGGGAADDDFGTAYVKPDDLAAGGCWVPFRIVGLGVCVLLFAITIPTVYIFASDNCAIDVGDATNGLIGARIGESGTGSFAGRWRYRSYFNLPQSDATASQLVFARGTMELFVNDADDTITGTLVGGDRNSVGKFWSLLVTGSQTTTMWQGKPATEVRLTAKGINGTMSCMHGPDGNDCWVYEYVGLMIPDNWHGGVINVQADTFVGSVKRVCCHSPIGLVISFVATRANSEGLLVRKNVLDLTQDEWKVWVGAVNKLKQTKMPVTKTQVFPDWTRYDDYVRLHSKYAMSAHMGPAFFPWHRFFLYTFEKELQKVSGRPNLTIPYWDWSNEDTRMNIFVDAWVGGNGTGHGSTLVDGPFASEENGWKHTIDYNGKLVPGRLQRAFGTPLGAMPFMHRLQFNDTVNPLLPPRQDLLDALNMELYDTEPWSDSSHHPPSFRNTFEGWETYGCRLHNTVHLWTGGHMRLVAISPNDPLFWLHHAFVDKVFDLYLRRNARKPFRGYLPLSGAKYGHNLLDRMDGFGDTMNVSPFDVLNTELLGYEYQTNDALDTIYPVPTNPPKKS